MQQTVIGDYRCIRTDDYVQIKYITDEQNQFIRCIRDVNDEADTLVTNQVEDNLLYVDTKQFRLLLNYDEDEDIDTNGRVELYFRGEADEEFINVVYLKTDIPQNVIVHIMNFLTQQGQEEIVNNNVNNNINNNNNPQIARGGRRRLRKTKKQRKQRRRAAGN